MAFKSTKRFIDIILLKRRIRITEKFVVFCFFLVFSSAIWYLNKLSGDYVIDLKLPVKVTYTDTDKILVDEGETYLKVQVKTKGYTILRYKFKTALNPVQIDIASYRLFRQSGSGDRYYVLSNFLKSNLATQLPSNIKIENINPDTLFFRFSSSYSKIVPIVASTKLSFEDQYMQVGHILISPNRVKISGPESVIRNVKYVKTELISGELLNESISGTTGLEAHPNILMSTKDVRYTVDVAKYAESTIRLPIKMSGVDSNSVLLIPSVAELTYRVALKDYGKVQASLFKLTVKGLPSGLSNLVKVKVDTFPYFVSHIRVDPEFVEVYNQKK